MEVLATALVVAGIPVGLAIGSWAHKLANKDYYRRKKLAAKGKRR